MRLEFLYRIRQQGMLYNLYKYLEDCQYMVWTNSRPGQSDSQGEYKHLARPGPATDRSWVGMVGSY